MCCFSRPVNSVTATRIFARFTRGDEQALIYQMRLDAPEDLAMILPIPVAQPAVDDALTFVNLEKYEGLFTDLERGFPRPPTLSIRGRPPAGDAKALKVHSVGSYAASFVPNVKSFARLDERFRLPAATWDALPQFAEFGFAVFKLRKGKSKVHPMAFKFPVAQPRGLFFPTVHIHDGKVHEEENFDHILYGQCGPGAVIPAWMESPRLASTFADPVKSEGLIQGAEHVYRRAIRGRQKNRDILVAARVI